MAPSFVVVWTVPSFVELVLLSELSSRLQFWDAGCGTPGTARASYPGIYPQLRDQTRSVSLLVAFLDNLWNEVSHTTFEPFAHAHILLFLFSH